MNNLVSPLIMVLVITFLFLARNRLKERYTINDCPDITIGNCPPQLKVPECPKCPNLPNCPECPVYELPECAKCPTKDDCPKCDSCEVECPNTSLDMPEQLVYHAFKDYNPFPFSGEPNIDYTGGSGIIECANYCSDNKDCQFFSYKEGEQCKFWKGNTNNPLTADKHEFVGSNYYPGIDLRKDIGYTTYLKGAKCPNGYRLNTNGLPYCTKNADRTQIDPKDTCLLDPKRKVNGRYSYEIYKMCGN